MQLQSFIPCNSIGAKRMDDRSIELGFIQNDTNDVRAIVSVLSGHEYAGYLSLALSPAIGFIAEETHNYLTSRNILTDPALSDSYKKVAIKLRALLKFFDDTEGGKSNVLSLLNLFQQKSSLWMNKGKKGIYKTIAQNFLQPDIGIYFVDEDPIYMTTVGFSAIGKTRQEIEALREEDFEDISEYARSFWIAIGEYLNEVKKVMIAVNIQEDGNLNINESSNIKVTHNDFLSSKLYKLICFRANIKDAALAPAVLFILSQVNVAHILLPSLLPKESNLLARVQVLTAYHAIKSLLEIKDDIDPDLVALLLNLDFSNSVPNFKKARNMMAHYGMGEGKKFVGSSEDPLDDIIQGFSGISKRELATLADSYLQQLSEWTRLRLSKGSLKEARALLGDHT